MGRRSRSLWEAREHGLEVLADIVVATRLGAEQRIVMHG
jgi:hypothetical protein